MKAGGKRTGSLSPRTLGLVLVALVLVVAALLGAREARIRDEARGGEGTSVGAAPVKRIHTLGEAPQAQFFSVIRFEPGGQPGSAVMIGSGTGEFETVAGALAAAEPVEGSTDDSFDVLIVISFGREDTLDISYSPSRNLIIMGEQAYRPAADLAPAITAVEDKFNY